MPRQPAKSERLWRRVGKRFVRVPEWRAQEVRQLGTRRPPCEQRLIDLTIAGVIPRRFPQYAAPNITARMILRETPNEALPWEIPNL
jgi:hypothetical protein